MGKKRRILLAALAVAILGGLVWFVFRPRDPVVRGKTLGEWLRRYVSADGTSVSGEPEADAVVLELGTNAIPTLLDMLRAHDSHFKLQVMELARKQSLFKIPPPSNEAWHRNVEAQTAFGVLGSRACDAVPAIIQIYHENFSSYSRQICVSTLANIGPGARDAVPFLLQTLTNTDENIRNDAAYALGAIHAEPALVVPALIQSLNDKSRNVRISAAWALGQYGTDAMSAVPALVILLADPDPIQQIPIANSLAAFGTNGAPAVPVLLNALTNSNPTVRANAARNLAKIRVEPTLIVPALTKTLSDPVAFNRRYATDSLGEFGTNAAAAVPALMPLLNDSNQFVRIAATNALKAIDPDAAAKAGVK